MPAANTDKFKKTKDLFSTTLSSSITSGDTTIPLNSTTGLSTATAVVLTIDGVDSSGVSTPSLREVIVGVVSGNNIVSVVRGAEGTQQAHNSGAVVTEYWTAKHINDLIDGLLVNINQDGGFKFTTVKDTNGNTSFEIATVASAVNRLKTTTAATGNNPSIQATGESNKALNILDSNGNESLKQVATASAVNELTNTNAATGTGPTLAATGDDTNIDFNIAGKGTGVVSLTQLKAKGYQGETAAKTANYTLTATDHTIRGDSSGGAFTVTLPTAVGVAGKRYTISKTEAGTTNAITVATTSSQTIDGITTFTLLGLCSVTVESDGSNWMIAGAMGSWSSYTPTWTGSGSNPAIGNGTMVGYMRKVGRTVEVRIAQTMGSTTTYGTGEFRWTIPLTPHSTFVRDLSVLGTADVDDAGTLHYASNTVAWRASASTIIIRQAGGINNIFGATVPFTFANTDAIDMNFRYPSAT